VVPVDRVDAVMRAVDAAFVLEGFRSPQHLCAVPSAGASVEHG
jgi:galactokinase